MNNEVVPLGSLRVKPSPMVWTGRVLTCLFALFMLGASIVPKLLGLSVVDETMAQLGWPPGYELMIGIIELGCLVLYLIPRTSILGAVLMMALLGGAMATQIRAGNPLFTHALFSIYLGLFMWGGLWLRDPRLRSVFPWSGQNTQRSKSINTTSKAEKIPPKDVGLSGDCAG